MYKLKVISSTVRPGRKGPLFANWIAQEASKTGNFDVEVLDLGELQLPVMNEPNHPRLKKYEHDYTKAWSQKIDEADALIFVTAEYNHTYPAALGNALEYLIQEWMYKAAGVVSYSGGAFGGVRAVYNLKAELITMKIVPLAEVVNIPSYNTMIEEGVFKPNTMIEASKDKLLTELYRWTKGMVAIKNDVPA